MKDEKGRIEEREMRVEIHTTKSIKKNLIFYLYVKIYLNYPYFT